MPYIPMPFVVEQTHRGERALQPNELVASNQVRNPLALHEPLVSRPFAITDQRLRSGCSARRRNGSRPRTSRSCRVVASNSH